MSAPQHVFSMLGRGSGEKSQFTPSLPHFPPLPAFTCLPLHLPNSSSSSFFAATAIQTAKRVDQLWATDPCTWHSDCRAWLVQITTTYYHHYHHYHYCCCYLLDVELPLKWTDLNLDSPQS